MMQNGKPPIAQRPGIDAVWLSRCGLNYRTEERSDRVVYEVTQHRWNCGLPFLDYHWLDAVATAPRFCS